MLHTFRAVTAVAGESTNHEYTSLFMVLVSMQLKQNFMKPWIVITIDDIDISHDSESK